MMTDAARAAPQFECDLILKGGITSGIVYPPAIAELAGHYRFRSVGGTSAGAIAAAMTAAAEVGRSSQTGGFALVEEIAQEFAETDASGRTRLFRLFQAQPETRPFFDLIWQLRSMKGMARLRAVARAVRSHGPRPLLVLGILAALAVGGLAIWLGIALGGSGTLWLSVPLGLALLLLAAIVGFAVVTLVGARRLAARAEAALTGNFLGLCNGATPGDSNDPALTQYLYDKLQQLAGRDDPGNEALRSVPVTYGEVAAAGGRLVTLTTNLSRGTSEQIPFEEAIWAFRPAEFARLFPAEVVTHMRSKAKPPDRDDVAAALGDELLLLPEPPDLPIIVGARMSLSFPVLLSAVPLYGLTPVRRDGEWEIVFVRNVFSDGGITSNMPVHLFDRPLPRRPTFAINLSGGADLDADACDNVRRPITALQGRLPPTKRVESTAGLLGAVFDTMQNWADNDLSRVAGFRERICTIRLGEGEGGMNLDMPPSTIAPLIERGACAGRNLASMQTGDLAGTGIPPGTPEGVRQWDRHRWTRFRIASGGIAQLVAQAGPPYGDAGGPGRPSYPDLGAEAAGDSPLPYASDWNPTRNGDVATAWTAVLRLGGHPPERLGDGTPAGTGLRFGASTDPVHVPPQPAGPGPAP